MANTKGLRINIFQKYRFPAIVSVVLLVMFAAVCLRFPLGLADKSPISPSVSMTTLGVPITQNFDTLPASGSATFNNDSTLPGWYSARTGTGTTVVANDGSSNAGNLYSYGTGTATDRALGSLGSGNAAIGNLFWGIKLTNNTGGTITSLDVSYTGEQWRNSAAAAQTVAFSYLIGSPTVTGSLAEFQSAGVAVTALDFTSPITGGAAGALNGNLAANRTAKSFTITGLSIPNGTDIMLRWSDPDHTGSDHGLAIDDFSVTPHGAVATPTLNINDVSQNEGSSGGTTTYTFTVSLTAPAPVGGVTFDIATADGTAQDGNPVGEDTDYTAKTLTSQTITAGNTSYTFDVLVNADTVAEANETFFVNVTNITGATSGDPQGQGTIVNDDANLTINDVSLNEGNSGQTSFDFTVSLSSPAVAGGVNFTINTADGTATTANNDYAAIVNGAGSIAQGNSSTTVSVLVNGDTTPEAAETFFVNLSNVTGANVIDGQGQGTILNDDGAVPSTVVISQVYGGGGNSGATLTNDFIELFNRTSSPVSLNGWAVQYASATGSSWQVTPLTNVTLAPGQYYLIQEAAGSGGTTALPAPDATGAIAMGATAGKIALTNSTTALTTTGCPAVASVVDFVGYGSTANCSEGGAPTPTLTNTTAALRLNGGCNETDNNAADFTTGAPDPRNTSDDVHVCGGPGNPSGVGAASPNPVAAGASSLLTVTVTPGTTPTSTGITVTGDLSAIGGPGAQQFFDDATNGDVTPGDNIFSYQATVNAGTTGGIKSLPISIADAQARAGSTNISLTVQAHDPSVSGSANPSTVAQGASVVLTATVVPGSAPASTGLIVTADLSAIGGSATQQFFDDGATGGDPVAGDNAFTFTITVAPATTTGGKSLPLGVTDAQARSGSGIISLTVTTPPAPHDPAEHLVMGNPNGATADVNFPDNYLMMKLQYALSYNNTREIPNWTSWHLDSSWRGSAPRQNDFRNDTTLPAGFHQVLGTDYSGSGFDRGHMCPSADRTSSIPDNSATFLMDNMVPQAPGNNQGPWAALENYLRAFLPGSELYIVSGGVGVGGTGSGGGTTNVLATGVTVPNKTWKVALILPLGDNDVSRVDANTRTIAVIMPNLDSIRPDQWQKYLSTIDQVETLTGYDFFSNVPPGFQSAIESKPDAGNDTAPVTTGQNLSTPNNQNLPVTLTASDFNVNNVFTYTIVTGPQHGSLSGGGANPVYSATTNYTGPDSFTFKANDGALDSNTSTVNITVTGPTATNGNVSGHIADSSGNPVECAAVRMNGTQNRLTVTDSSGNYNFENVESNGVYTVTPSRANFSFSPAQRSFSAIGQHTDAVFTASPTGGGSNPLDRTEYFVRQQYVDFLGREPDEAGLNFWVNNIESCGTNANCREANRRDTSAAFFLSIEFQQTGYFVDRMYKSAYGDMPGAQVPVTFAEFRPDAQRIGQGVVVNQSGWERKLEDNKASFASEFVQRARFASAYPTTMPPDQFVDGLLLNAGVTPAALDRSAAISEFGLATNTSDSAARGRALRRVTENSALAQKEFSQAFVLMQYFGYLRRDPNATPDTDFSGYNSWLNKLDSFGGNYANAEMVQAFLVAGEYRGRFPR